MASYSYRGNVLYTPLPEPGGGVNADTNVIDTHAVQDGSLCPAIHTPADTHLPNGAILGFRLAQVVVSNK